MMGQRAPTAPAGASKADSAALEPLLVQLLKLAAMINRPMEDGVANPNGLSLNELRIMMCLHGEGACAGHDITELMAIPPMNVSRALASLANRGWIEPALDPGNRRRRPVRLSEEGKNACLAMEGDIDSVAHELLGMLSASEATALQSTVDAVIGRLEKWPAEHPRIA
jgi:DNA-binding MarR family transcriptional regulator